MAELKVVKSIDAQRNRLFVEKTEMYLAGLTEQLTAFNILLTKDGTKDELALFDSTYF